MLAQIITYSLETGRVRHVLDPLKDLSEPELLALHPPRAGEGATVYPKRGLGPDGRGLDDLHAWQAHVAVITGKLPSPVHPDTEAAVLAACPHAVRQPHDVHEIVDSTGAVIGRIHCDSHETIPGHTLRRAAVP